MCRYANGLECHCPYIMGSVCHSPSDCEYMEESEEIDCDGGYIHG